MNRKKRAKNTIKPEINKNEVSRCCVSIFQAILPCYISVCVYNFAHCPCSLSTLLDWVEFTICTLHRSLLAVFKSTLVTPQCSPSPQCVTVHPVPKFSSCHKAIMVIIGRAYCNPLDICVCIKVIIEHSSICMIPEYI